MIQILALITTILHLGDKIDVEVEDGSFVISNDELVSYVITCETGLEQHQKKERKNTIIVLSSSLSEILNVQRRVNLKWVSSSLETSKMSQDRHLEA